MFQQWIKTACFVSILGVSAAHAEDQASKQALSCSQISQCTYFADLYQKDSLFQAQIAQAFTQAALPLPSWLSHSTSVPMIPVLIKGETFLIGLGGEQHNMPHQAAVLYSPTTKKIAIRYVDAQDKVHFIGASDAVYLDVLKQYVDPTTALSHIVTSDYATLPVILNPYLSE